MSTITGVAQSGLEAASRRLEVSASNVANALRPGFVPSRVASSEVAGGGVTSSVVQGVDAAAEARADRALLASSGTDLASEIVAQSQAARLYQANLATLKTADELFQAALKLKP
jgi:flagellar basal-body rod protein FlgC